MAVTRTSDISALLLAGSDEVFNRAAGAPREQQYKAIVREKKATKKVMNYDTMGALSGAQKHVEGNAIMLNKIEYNNRTSITSYVIENGVQATWEAQELDLYNEVRKYFGEPLVDTMNTLKEETVALAYTGVFTDTGADGVAIASDSHPLKNSALLNDNLLAAAAFGPDSFIAAKNMLNHIYTQAGKPFNTSPTHLVIHPDKAYLALQVLGSALMALELSNTKNTVNDYNPVKIIYNRYLPVVAGVSPWFLLDKSLAEAGCLLQTNAGLSLHTWMDWGDLTFKGVCFEMYGCGFVAPGYGFVACAGL